MIRNWKAIWLTLLLFPASAFLALAQTLPDVKGPPALPDFQKDAKKATDEGEKKAPLVAPEGDLKDVTTPSQKLKDVLNAGQSTKSGPLGNLPTIVLRGRVVSKDRPPLAILELGKNLYIVNQGSVLPGPGNTTLRVLEVNSTEVRIEGPLKEVLSFR